jgi:hypothetical protein
MVFSWSSGYKEIYVQKYPVIIMNDKVEIVQQVNSPLTIISSYPLNDRGALREALPGCRKRGRE